MTAAKANAGVAAEDRKFLADRYRQAAFDLLRAARVLRDTATTLRASRQRVAPTALVDLDEAIAIIAAMPSVPAAQATKS